MPNSDLIELDPDTVLNVKMDKMRKDLQAAHQLASESHPLAYYKEVLQQYQEELLEQEAAKAAKAAAKAATPSKKKSKAPVDEDGDVEMGDAGDTETPAKDKKAKKRKAEENIEVCQSPSGSITWSMLTDNRHRRALILSRNRRSS